MGPTGNIWRLLCAAVVGISGAANAQEVFGYIEPVALPGAGISVLAKLDTGADTSSLDATDIRRVRRGERRLVKFLIRDPESGEETTLERDYVRTTRIRRHYGEIQRRHVVMMAVCLGRVSRTVEINLVDRSNFSYPMLLGRNALAGVALVDPAMTETSQPQCDDDWEPADGRQDDDEAAEDQDPS